MERRKEKVGDTTRALSLSIRSSRADLHGLTEKYQFKQSSKNATTLIYLSLKFLFPEVGTGFRSNQVDSFLWKKSQCV